MDSAVREYSVEVAEVSSVKRKIEFFNEAHLEANALSTSTVRKIESYCRDEQLDSKVEAKMKAMESNERVAKVIGTDLSKARNPSAYVTWGY